MKFLLNLTTDNAAFHDQDCPDKEHECLNQAAEIARILREVSKHVNSGFSGFFKTIYDANGNDVGRYALKPDSYRAAASELLALLQEHTENTEIDALNEPELSDLCSRTKALIESIENA